MPESPNKSPRYKSLLPLAKYRHNPFLTHVADSMTPSQARNAIRKALTGIIDPKPRKSEIDAMWEHFQRKCAFCGTKLKRTERKGHADHLVAATEGGHNHIYNRVLACARCNGDEKLDHDWLTFLASVAQDPKMRARRQQKIEAWQKQHRAECSTADSQTAAALIVAEKVIKVFNDACEQTRSLRKQH